MCCVLVPFAGRVSRVHNCSAGICARPSNAVRTVAVEVRQQLQRCEAPAANTAVATDSTAAVEGMLVALVAVAAVVVYGFAMHV